ncbi:MAG TPA: hypothetical protein VEZ38_05650, partial [Paenibacillus sp.]|nr:hypothetical protein [Paenibacillus sp.]
MKTLVRPGAWVLLLMGFALVLAACLNDPENKEGDKTTPSTVETPVEEVPPPEAPQTPVEAPVELPETKELQVAVEGETMNVPASLTRSELGYAFYLLEGFEFTPEEPGKDMVFHKEFGE